MTARGALAIALCVSGPSLASEPSVFGSWCNNDSDVLEIDAKGMGNFEHMVCGWDKPQGPRKTIDTEIHCRVMHFEGKKIIEIQNATYHFKARLLSSEQLEVDYSDGHPPSTLQRCSL